jgi:hypothetical protein
MITPALALSVAICALAGSAVADGALPGNYFGIGMLEGALSFPGLKPDGNGAANTGSGNAIAGAAGYSGYRLTQNWGIEGGYNNLGTGYSIQGMRNGAPYAMNGIGAYNYYVAGTATFPLSAGCSVFGKLGLAVNRADLGVIAREGNSDALGYKHRTDPMFGVGTDYVFNAHHSLRLEYENYGRVSSDGDGDGAIRASTVTLAIQYTF